MDNEYINENFRPADSPFSKNFSLTLKKEFIDNRKAILLETLGILGICITIGTFLGFNYSGGGIGELTFCSFLFLIIGCVTASMAFSNLKRKDTRIAALLVPDTMFDKFFIRWIAVVPVLLIILIIGFYFVEFSRIIVFKIVHSSANMPNYGDYCEILNPFKVLNLMNDPSGEPIVATFFTSYLFSQSFYILGSALWPKLSFIKTFAVLWVIQTIVSIVLMSIHIELPDGFQIDGNTFFWCVSAGEAILSILIYFLAYMRFKNTQVIDKLF